MKLSTKLICILGTLAIAGSTLADPLLVGTDLSTAAGGETVCPGGSDCSFDLQQFTLNTPVTVDSVSVVLNAPTANPYINGSFQLALLNSAGQNLAPIGSGTYVYPSNPNLDPVNELFTFNNLGLSINPGTYYLELYGFPSDTEWTYASPLATPFGTLGQSYSCDPFITCGVQSRWDVNPDGPFAMSIDGTVTPEPPAFLLLATGLLLGLATLQKRHHKLLS